ncbi:MAG: prepilin-type N-terminal cleavage/methylation domain-containing protein [Burkholderiales bacterium]|nr:prepilin-type N-terminal cleavage/methylation domain-containing protein [Burkholderiales bacterium]
MKLERTLAMQLARGFTLIELLIVVAIIGVIAAIAVPQYGDYLTRSKLTEATATLSEHRVKMEQFFQDNRTYVSACATGSIAATPTGRYFNYACSNLTATTFTVTATGIAAQGTDGFVFTIDQANARATTGVKTGWSGAGATCWVTNKSGGC